MNKTFYNLGIVILALATVVGILQSVFNLLVGGQLFMFPSFSGWFWLAMIISLGSSIILLKYYHYKHYTFSFWTAAISALGSLTQQILLYVMVSGGRIEPRYYIAILFFLLTAGIAYALSFIFSPTSKHVWLKRAGIISFVVSIALLILLIINTASNDMSVKLSTKKEIEWTLLLTNIVPLFFTLNFLQERKQVTRANTTIVFLSKVTTLIQITCVVTFCATLIVGGAIIRDTVVHLYWQRKNAERTANLVQRGEERTFTNQKGTTLKYLLIKPEGYNLNTKYPLVVSLPYAGYEAPPAQLLTDDNNPSRYPAFIFVPFCPEGSGWGGIPNYPTIDTLVFEAILKLDEDMSIDVNRRYVSGVSRGAYGAWHFITTRPDLFAAAIPVSGGGDPELAQNIVNVPVWAFHGALDHNVPVSKSREMIDAIKKAGGNPKYTEFPDKAHSIWYEVTQAPGLLDWLFEQKKDSTTSVM